MDNEKVIASVFDLAVADMWNEPKRMGFKYCCEDVVNAAATYAAQCVIYGIELVRSRSLWPYTPVGYLGTDSELELYRTMLDASIEYAREHGAEHGIEFEDVWE